VPLFVCLQKSNRCNTPSIRILCLQSTNNGETAVSIFLIYFLVMVPAIKSAIGVGLEPAGVVLFISIAALSLFTAARTAFSAVSSDEHVRERAETPKLDLSGPWKYLRRVVYVYVLAAVFFVFLPSERQMLVMAGAYTITNIEGISKLPENAVGAMNAWLGNLAKAAIVEGDTASLENIEKAAKALTAVK
jgi:hypothetical protein